jgi:hypothetical protein
VSYRVTASQGQRRRHNRTLAQRPGRGRSSSDSGAMNVQLQNLGNVAYDKVRAIR